mmetsp:Transcript_25881/g.62537  ORF Transcript_25881/g.62537 Transcript_25881/m.62537 type:complete len:92 (-) Transcript_25881:185-460(-)
MRASLLWSTRPPFNVKDRGTSTLLLPFSAKAERAIERFKSQSTHIKSTSKCTISSIRNERPSEQLVPGEGEREYDMYSRGCAPLGERLRGW